MNAPATASRAPEAFAAALLRGVEEEGIALDAATRERLVDEAWRHFEIRPEGRHDVRVAIMPASGAGDAEATIVEIVNDDMPFLVESAVSALLDRGLEIALLLHPIFDVERDGEGRLTRFHGEAGDARLPGARRESLIHIEVADGLGESERETIQAELDQTFADVRAATGDWSAMRDRLGQAADAVSSAAHLPDGECREAAEFLRWLVDTGFVAIGMREFTYDADAENEPLAPVSGTGLGILRDRDLQVLRRGRELVVVTPEIRAFLMEPAPIIITKANLRSRVKRRSHLDLIEVKLFGTDGRLAGELRVVGLFAAAAFNQRAATIPYLRRKVKAVEARLDFDPESYSGRQLVNVLETYPRDDLFQIDTDLLAEFAGEIMSLYERPRVGALARPDRFDRFVSVLVYVPRDRYDSAVRARIGDYLAEVYDGRVSAYYPAFLESVPLTRVHFVIGRYEGPTPVIDRAVLEREIARRVRTWSDMLRSGLRNGRPAQEARRLADLYAEGFEPGYSDAFAPEQAIADIEVIDRLDDENRFAVDLYRGPDLPDTQAALRIIVRNQSMPLSLRVPALDQMGFSVLSERTFRINGQMSAQHAAGAPVFLHEMLLERAAGGPVDLPNGGIMLEELMMAVARGLAETDGFNALTLEAGLDWRRVSLVRAIARYLRQAAISFSADYMWGVLTRHAAIAADIVALFEARFDPAVTGRDAAQENIRAQIEDALTGVDSLDEDRILRRFVNVVDCMLRTNFYQRDAAGEAKEEISFKLDSRRLDGLPAPRPLVEIFVYSPRVEGVHLRFGRIARGGLRWSDRREDFRTEVLGLVKAQQVKNAVIVPVGAKGGFVPKRLPPASDRAAWTAEGTQSYRIFVSALLDLTDNLDAGTIVPPRDVVRHDGDDPYLVVAADKGTATFSDTANALAADHGFWLGDAFASGGSVGYDHKKMGITARGGWEAVKRHFREMDRDIQTTPFTVAGVGDMSGDVFGNGMLLSREIRLVAAFDHRDIFIDPAPDAATSFAERARLFALPRSSWADYDKALISKGGGVFSRAAKSIPLSAGMRTLLGIGRDAATPQEIMRAILMLDVDLLWFGGIGTYVRASEESDAEVGDRANDAIRITAPDLRTRVIGEGANLGMTQQARIEAALAGVRLNTDAIDNSAGVNSSDYEVNIKIALKIALDDGRLSMEARNAFLATMTDDVAELVLANNYRQTLALTLAQRRGIEDLGFAQRMMQTLERRSLLDRSVEFLPSDAEIAERGGAGRALTRPELAVLLAYAKIALFDDLLEGPVPDDPHLAGELDSYFPNPLVERFGDTFATHRLRREIIATMLANSMIDQGGPTLVTRMVEQTGASVATIAAAFSAVFNAFRMPGLVAGVDALDNRVPSALQTELYAGVQDLLISRMVWFIRNVDLTGDIGAIITRFQAGADALMLALRDGLGGDIYRERAADLAKQGVPENLAGSLAALPALYGAPDAVVVAEAANCETGRAAATLFAVADWLGLPGLRARASAHTAADVYERLAIDQAIASIGVAEREIAIAVATGAHDDVEAWAVAHPDAERLRSAVAEIARADFSLARLIVAAGLLEDLAKLGHNR